MTQTSTPHPQPQSPLGYTLPVYEFELPPELHPNPSALGLPSPYQANAGDSKANSDVNPVYPVVIVGGGLGGLSLGVDLLQRGVPVVLIDEDNTVGVRGASSRGICYAQKSLEIFARLGIYERIAAKGVQWQVGRTLDGADEVYSFDLRDNAASNVSVQPPFVNIQQYYVEWFLVERFLELAPKVQGSSLRWLSTVTRCAQNDETRVTLNIQTPQGDYTLQTQWLVDASGVNSSIRNELGLAVQGTKGEDRWCISDVRFKTEPAAERWTWIQAPFNDNRAVWQHLMADGVWRLDYQLAPDTPMEKAADHRVVTERLQRQFGEDVDFELVWVGPYGYRSQMLTSFQHGRVLFVGDVAHVMSPFGARGGNSAIQDADNLGWKLAAVLQRGASPKLLDSYSAERVPAAQENIELTRRTMRFLSPKPGAQMLLRSAVLGLAKTQAFARSLVNTGRMSVSNVYSNSPLNVGVHGGRPIQNVMLKRLASESMTPTATLHTAADASAAACDSATNAASHAPDLASHFSLLALMQALHAGVLLVGVLPETGYPSKMSSAQPSREHSDALLALAKLASQLPAALRVRTVLLNDWCGDPSGALLAQLGGLPSGVAIVRPDLYCAGTASWSNADALIARFNESLGYSLCLTP
jgi:3-(3-hydroxy-phenyl)propionate hydroxylase